MPRFSLRKKESKNLQSEEISEIIRPGEDRKAAEMLKLEEQLTESAKVFLKRVENISEFVPFGTNF